MQYKILSKLRILFVKISIVRYRIIYIGIALSIVMLISNEITYIILLVPYGYYIIKVHRDLIVYIVVILALYGLSITNTNLKALDIKNEYSVKIIGEIKHKEHTSFKGKIDNQLIIVYLDNLNDEISPGDVLTIKGSLEQVKQRTIPHTFSYKNYLLSKKVKYVLYTTTYEVDEVNLHINDLQLGINRYITKNMPLSKKYVKTFVLANKEDFDEEFVLEINKLGVSHLFAVSGLHIGIVILISTMLLKKVTNSTSFIEYSISSLLILYMIITSFSPSVVRASLMYILLVINKKIKLDLSVIDILSLIYILLLLSNPYYYINVGFILSFLVTTSILLSRHILTKKTNIESIFIITSIAFIISIPITTSLNNEINLFTLFINIILIYYMTYIILPFGYITFFIRITDFVYNIFIKVFEAIIGVSTNLNMFTLNITISNSIQIMIYYYFIFFMLSKISTIRQHKTTLILMTIFIVFMLNQEKLNPSKKVSILDVFGDSIMVKDSFDKCNILVDTGIPDSYDSVITYLKGEHIKRLDYIIITHNHSDHSGELFDILKEFDVRHVINQENIHLFDKLECGSLNLTFFQSNSLNDDNNDSVVFQLLIENRTYLFTGDIELERERSLLLEHNMKSDYLKTPHHGSITSSTEAFIDHVDPEEVFITCYEGNRHGHPHDEVIRRYQDRGIYINRIDEHGTIEMIYLFGNEFKKIHNR